MPVLMVRIVDVPMLMLNGIMRVLMLMALEQVEQQSNSHKGACQKQAR